VNSAAYPFAWTVLYSLLRLSTSFSVKTKKAVSLGLARYSASFSPPDLNRPLSEMKITRRSAKKGSVSARSMIWATSTLRPW
jgi:hypothetical protein